jgi:hypothetical protein
MLTPPAAVFRWSTPHATLPRWRVADVEPVRAWLASLGYDVTVCRVNERVRVDLPRVRQPERGDRLAQVAHLLRGAGYLATEHRMCRIIGVWIDDSLPYGSRLPIV